MKQDENQMDFYEWSIPMYFVHTYFTPEFHQECCQDTSNKEFHHFISHFIEYMGSWASKKVGDKWIQSLLVTENTEVNSTGGVEKQEDKKSNDRGNFVKSKFTDFIHSFNFLKHELLLIDFLLLLLQIEISSESFSNLRKIEKKYFQFRLECNFAENYCQQGYMEIIIKKVVCHQRYFKNILKKFKQHQSFLHRLGEKLDFEHYLNQEQITVEFQKNNQVNHHSDLSKNDEDKAKKISIISRDHDFPNIKQEQGQGRNNVHEKVKIKQGIESKIKELDWNLSPSKQSTDCNREKLKKVIKVKKQKKANLIKKQVKTICYSNFKGIFKPKKTQKQFHISKGFYEPCYPNLIVSSMRKQRKDSFVLIDGQKMDILCEESN